MKRMRILSVKSIPRFIGEYFNKKLIDIETINEFSKLLTTIDIRSYSILKELVFLLRPSSKNFFV